MNKVLIVAPFWQTLGHVGNYRVDRYIRWLNDNNYYVSILRAGKKNEVQKKEWGIEIIKKDYIFIITEILRRLSNKTILKLIWYLWLTLILKFSPVDEFFIWASKILSGGDFKKYFKDINLIISTSPPNSSHIAAYKISNKYSVPLIIDLRDGWLDEPLEQKLVKTKLLREKEINFEKIIMEHSSKIFVTSKSWKEMLFQRIPNIDNKIIIITNAYPDYDFSNEYKDRNKVSLLYAGRFTGSSKKRSLDLLLNPLYNALKKDNSRIDITFLSELRREELKLFENWKMKFTSLNISLKLYQHLPRIEMFEFINRSDGLLLISAGFGPLPSKLFEYIKAGKPIFAVTPRGSAVSQLSEKLPQLFLYDKFSDGENYSSIIRFINACRTENYQFNTPEEFTESYLSKIFLKEIETLLE